MLPFTSRLSASLAILIYAALAVLALSPSGHAMGFGENGSWEPYYIPDQPQTVGVGIKVDQITSIDQQSENFGIVGTIIFKFSDPRLAYEVQGNQVPLRTMPLDAFLKIAREKQVNLPSFILSNQQGRRFVQQDMIVHHANGDILYHERFTATLQAPHFNFRRYPFDKQKFFVEVQALLPETHFKLTPIEDLSGLGDMLGEEEWIPHNPKLEAITVQGPTGLDTSQVQLSFEANRHIQFYALRILLPLLIILFVSWATFFLEEYRRRVDMANANLLVFVAFNFAISTTLPRLGYLTFLDSLLVGMFVITGSMVLVNIALRRLKLNGREVLAKKIDRYLVIWVYPLTYAGFLFWAIRFYLL